MFHCKKDEYEMKNPPTTPKTPKDDKNVIQESPTHNGCGNMFLKIIILDLSHDESQDFSRFRV